MLDLVPLEKPEVFVSETPSRMMAFLVADVIDYSHSFRQVTPTGFGVFRAGALL
ncbi:MAG TPA: hypothetical protein VG146_06720 [Verrucomicrobiae bacterium]|nr:hypothetical protein [Verrucomicrobiae bacterium]